MGSFESHIYQVTVRGSQGYTGHLLERELFGTVRGRLKMEYREYLEWQKRSGPDKFSFLHIFKILKNPETQPGGDPLNPQRYFARCLRQTIFKKMKMRNPQDLEFYTAVMSPLDYAQGTDAFFNFPQDKICISLDVTIRPQKIDFVEGIKEGDGEKTDVVFFFPSGGLDPLIFEKDKEPFFKIVEGVALSVINMYNKYKAKGGRGLFDRLNRAEEARLRRLKRTITKTITKEV